MDGMYHFYLQAATSFSKLGGGREEGVEMILQGLQVPN